MRILFFIEGLGSGGKERRLVELIKGLSNVPNFEMELVITKDNIHYKSIFNTGIMIHYTIRKNLKKDPRIFRKFYRIAKKFNPDVIHVWGNLAAIYAIPTKIFLKIPMINNQITDAPLKVYNSFKGHNLTFPFSDLIIANSFAGIKTYNAPIKKSIVIYNGFDFNRLNNIKDKSLIREKYNIKTNYVVGMVASFNSKKDYDSYLKVANLILNKNEDVTFVCIGSGDYSIHSQKVKIENKAKILFLGRLQNVEDVMNLCDIGVLTTYTEGISNAILEFMALKKPVVVAGEGGCSELIEDGNNGYLLNSKDINGLEKKINSILDDKNLAKEFGSNSFEIVKNKFNIKKMITKYIKVYDEFR